MKLIQNQKSVRRGVACALGAGLLAAAGWAQGVAIHYRVTDLADTGSGPDRWRADYMVTGGPFLAGEGFVIEFDFDLYSQLQDPPAPVNGDWDIVVLQPDVGLSDNGFYDAIALGDNASLADLFSVTFVWQGAVGIPGPQPYTIYDSSFAAVATGMTVALPQNVPVVAPLALIGAGMLGLAAARRRKG